jgi:hypothetical protein
MGSISQQLMNFLTAAAKRFPMDRFVKYSLEVLTIAAMLWCGLSMTHVNHTDEFGVLKDDLSYIGLATVVALGIAILVVFEGLPDSWATGLMWGTACFMCGAVLGLIFGIPPLVPAKPADTGAPNTALAAAQSSLDKASKAAAAAQEALAKAQKDQSAAQSAGSNPSKAVLDATVAAQKADDDAEAKQAAAQASVNALGATPSGQTAGDVAQQKKSAYGVNTNLTDISDWLTKIIVGVGLVQLGKIKSQLKVAANFVAGGLASARNANQASLASFALGIILYFSVLGFLSSYLLARVWLPLLLNSAS